ncbi:MAG: hypothetical protein C0483_14130 [Pirellula sp.]|nr:hypothetical protein [Pirellula sp.]
MEAMVRITPLENQPQRNGNHYPSDAEIYAGLDVFAEYEELGAVFTSSGEHKRSCYSLLREEGGASAYVRDNGKYGDSSGGATIKEINLWEVAAQKGRHGGDWKDAKRYYAEKSGSQLVAVKNHSTSNGHANGRSVSKTESSTESGYFQTFDPLPMDDGAKRLLAHFCRTVKQGTATNNWLNAGVVFGRHTIGVRRNGVLAWSQSWKVFALPIFGERLLSITSADEIDLAIIGYVLFTRNPLDSLTVWNAAERKPDPVKMKTYGLPGVQYPADGFVHRGNLQRIIEARTSPQANLIDEICWFEGPTDTVAGSGMQPDETTRERNPIVSTAGGAKQCNQWHIEFVSGPGVPLVLCGDCDDAGVAGVSKKGKSLTTAGVRTFHISLPHEIESKHGFDVRDWKNAGATWADAQARKTSWAPSAEQEAAEAADDQQQKSAASLATDRKEIPHNDEAERGLLGSILQRPERVASVIDITPDHFGNAKHSVIVRQILELYAEGVSADALLVVSRLKSTGQLEAAGGAEYLTELAGAVRDGDWWMQFAKDVRSNKHRRRAFEIIAQADRLLRAGRNAEDVVPKLLEQLEEQKRAAESAETETYGRMTFPQVGDADFHTEYLIDEVLPAGSFGILAGPQKTHKTHMGFELVASLAVGKPFLGCNQFSVTDAVRAGIISAESGPGANKEAIERVCASKGFRAQDVSGAVLFDTIPRDPYKCEKLIRDDALQLLVIDPLYQAIKDSAEFAANDMAMGKALAPYAEIAKSTGCCIVLTAHCRKNRTADLRRYDAPQLEEVAHAGVGQWARFWLMLGKRKESDLSIGQHQLWLRTGGSAGHGGLFAVDVFEGKQHDPGGRVWQPTVSTVGDVIQQREQETEKKKADKTQRTIDRHVIALRNALKKCTDGETAKGLRSRTGINTTYFTEAIDTLIGRGEAIIVEIKKGKQTYDGFKYQDPNSKETGMERDEQG